MAPEPVITSRRRSASHVRPSRLPLTTKRLVRAHHRSGETGAIIILALAFLTVIATLVIALFSLSQVGSSSLKNFRHERVRRYNAEGALQSAVQYVKANPRLGEGTGNGTLSLCMTYFMKDEQSPVALGSVATNSFLRVYCGPTNGQSSGLVTPSSFDADGGQPTRDVTIEVRCSGGVNSSGKLACGASGSTRVLARARIRYDIDYGITPTLPDCGPIDVDPSSPTFLQNFCYGSTVRAVVPKVVYWSINT